MPINQPKFSTHILCLIQGQNNKFWLLFLHNQIHNFTKKMRLMGRDSSSASELAKEQ
jgi:hypothetical protein